MTREELLVHAVVIMAGLVGTTLLVLLFNALRVAATQYRQSPKLAAATSTIAAAVEGTKPDAVALAQLAGLSTTGQIAVFATLGDNVAGIQRERLASVAMGTGLLARGERWCQSPRWGRRLRGVRLLTLLGAGQTIVPTLLDDPRPEVRAQAAQWVGEHPEAGLIEPLLAMLADPDTLCRFTARDALVRVGRPAIEPLLRHLSNCDGEPAAEALDLAAGMADSRFLAPALDLCGAPEAQIRSRAATLLGAIGGSRATTVLTALLEDTDLDVRASAAGGLGRLQHWPAATALALCLRDPSWDVRLASAVALRAVGAPGVLLLRRALTGEDRFARDMAHQVLELPADGRAAAAPAPTPSLDAAIRPLPRGVVRPPAVELTAA